MAKPARPEPEREERQRQLNLWYALAAFSLLMLFQGFWLQQRAVETVPYSEFERLVAAGKVQSVTVADHLIEGTLKEALPDGRSRIATVRVDPSLAGHLAERGITVTGAPPPGFLSQLLSWVAPAVVLYLIWSFAFRRMAERQGLGGLMSIGKSRAKVYMETDTRVTFVDVAGVDEAKAELQEIVAFLQAPDDYGRLGARMPKGILLVGPPGTGKTLLARAVAGEAGVAFFSISGSEFVEMFVGVGAARVRDLFTEARKSAPCIIFIDELDALGRARMAGGLIGGADEKEQTLNQLLTELDGFDPTTGVVLLAATNRPEILDPALLRAGRFDRQVVVDRPDRHGRVQILQVHARKLRLAPDVDLDAIAALTPGATGADLANLMNEAALLATRRRAELVSQADLVASVERIIAGVEKRSRVLNPAERRRVAVHEMGHALVAAALPGVDPVLKVSIIPRGIGALGYTIQRPTEDRFLLTRSELEQRIAVLLGGRVAEQLEYDGDVSTGAADDLQRATEIARDMVTLHGMDAGLGQRVYAPPRSSFLAGAPLPFAEPRDTAEATQHQIDRAVMALVEAGAARAAALLGQQQAVLHRGVAQLLREEVLTAESFPALQRPPATDPACLSG